jgi:hypothetical protein
MGCTGEWEWALRGGGMRKTEQRMGMTEHALRGGGMRKTEQRMGMTEHGNEKHRTRNGNGGRTEMTEREW